MRPIGFNMTFKNYLIQQVKVIDTLLELYRLEDSISTFYIHAMIKQKHITLYQQEICADVINTAFKIIYDYEKSL